AGRGERRNVRDGAGRLVQSRRLRAADAHAAPPLPRGLSGRGGGGQARGLHRRPVEPAPRAVSAERIGGIFAPITTPFDAATGEVAPIHLRHNTTRLLAEGLDGVLVAGSTGEAPLLDPDEQRRMTGWVREVVPEGKWLFVGTGAES